MQTWPMPYGKRSMFSMQIKNPEKKTKIQGEIVPEKTNFCPTKCLFFAPEVGEVGGMCPADFRSAELGPATLICFLPYPHLKWEPLVLLFRPCYYRLRIWGSGRGDQILSLYFTHLQIKRRCAQGASSTPTDNILDFKS